MVRACLLAVLLSTAHVAALHGTAFWLRLNFAYDQEGSPIALLSVSSDTIKGPFSRVGIQNATKRRIERFVLAAVLRETPVDGKPLLYESRPILMPLEPNATASVDTVLMEMSAFEDLARRYPDGTLELGVLEVTFADGSKWRFDVAKKMRFSPVK